MKKLIILILILTVSVTKSNNEKEYSLAIRNLKLANSYREKKDYNKALKLLDGAKAKFSLRKDWNSKYWLATTYEYYGYVYRDIDLLDESRANFEKALSIYQGLIRQKDGSPAVLDEIVKNVENLDSEINQINPFDPQADGVNVMNYDNLKLKELPADLPKKVVNLSFADNKFKDIPAGINNFRNLKYLNLKKNKISNINESLFELKELLWLDLSSNKIKKINLGFNKLSKLKVLDLSNNKLKDVPADLIKVKSLRVLNLKGNKIPFDKLKNFIKLMPNTNILHDEYVIKPMEEEEIETPEQE